MSDVAGGLVARVRFRYVVDTAIRVVGVVIRFLKTVGVFVLFVGAGLAVPFALFVLFLYALGVV